MPSDENKMKNSIHSIFSFADSFDVGKTNPYDLSRYLDRVSHRFSMFQERVKVADVLCFRHLSLYNPIHHLSWSNNYSLNLVRDNYSLLTAMEYLKDW